MKKILQFDIARGRVPRPETVFRMIDLLLPYGLKGIIFYLESVVETTAFPSAGAGKNPVIREYLETIRHYTDSKGIDFIPHFEIFSHQANLLSLPGMGQYADSEGGHCFRLDLPEVREKIKTQIKEVSSYFSSEYVHCGGDEAFELGLGRSRPYFEKMGFENAFVDFVNEINSFLRSLGKKMLFYADTPIVYPGLIRKLDADIIMVNWAYCVQDEIYEVENYHFCRHDSGVEGHRFWVTGNCMAEYVFTPFERLEENVAIWRKLGKNAEAFVISDWGSDQNTNPFTLTALGAMYALKSFEDASYSKEDFIHDVESMILNRKDSGFRNAYRILLNASGTEYWNRKIFLRGPVLPGCLFGDPESRPICLECGMVESESLERLERDVRSAVESLHALDSASALRPEMLDDLKALSKRVLAAVLRFRLCFQHAHDTGGIWFTQPELEPRIHLYEECIRLMKDDLQYMLSNWRKDSLDTCIDLAEELYKNAIATTKKALRLPENTLRYFPPAK